MAERQTAIVFGVGPGLGWALVKRFAEEKMQVGAVARNAAKLNALIGPSDAGGIRPYAADVSNSDDVNSVFEAIDRDLGEPDLVIFNAGAFEKANVLDIDPSDFERCWRIGCLGGLLVGQAAARRMIKRGHGTIIFSGATAALRGSAGFANLAVPKFGLRALAQSMARELGPQGIHIGFVIIDGQIESERYQNLIDERGADSLLAPDAIAELYLQLHRQPRSAWSHEMDVRPWSEKF
ncbi:SDR family NAD(P)-dependent oxidoreductase [Sphingomonas sp. 28-63-12]|uniref:SDR family NAD(P)-dependent oxidoreductase n=1 Tax=Sphingomonas sp. 28-63-12 TaxID=1970434 RepID=UPI000BCCCC81|nr:MAG: short-chain dehydrogenase [Sphingomonas sp. 28-63-12]